MSCRIVDNPRAGVPSFPGLVVLTSASGWLAGLGNISRVMFLGASGCHTYCLSPKP